MSTTLTMSPAQAVRFHLSLNVSDLGRSVAFYRSLFNAEPAKLRGDYAKFEIDDPPVVLSLEPTPRAIGGPLNHLGFRMPNAAALVAMQERLERAGIRSQREEGVECCYARQTKFWVHDPDNTLWEVYTLDGDIEHRGAGQLPEKVLPQKSAVVATAAPAVWEHRLGESIPERATFADGSLNEVRLRGSFNMPLSEAQRRHLLAEAKRALAPGGRLFVHVLTAERPFTGSPDLPGPAAVVRTVPVDADMVGLVESLGFEGVRLLKLDAKPCFVRNDVAMRETQIEAWKPEAGLPASAVAVYKGPFLEIRDDSGRTYARGRRVPIDAPTAQRLRAPEWAEQFLVLDNAPE
jgi:catechol 2,3-dioxygenase-like lactoylglutathione lyase family enzyme